MVRHAHPRVEAYVAALTLDDLPPLPKLTGPLSKEVRAHRSYRGMQLDGFEEPEGSKAMDYERQEYVGSSCLPDIARVRLGLTQQVIRRARGGQAQRRLGAQLHHDPVHRRALPSARCILQHRAAVAVELLANQGTMSPPALVQPSARSVAGRRSLSDGACAPPEASQALTISLAPLS
jgi:hypothetical protein